MGSNAVGTYNSDKARLIAEAVALIDKNTGFVPS